MSVTLAVSGSTLTVSGTLFLWDTIDFVTSGTDLGGISAWLHIADGARPLSYRKQRVVVPTELMVADGDGSASIDLNTALLLSLFRNSEETASLWIGIWDNTSEKWIASGTADISWAPQPHGTVPVAVVESYALAGEAQDLVDAHDADDEAHAALFAETVTRTTADGDALADANRFEVGQYIGAVWVYCVKTGTQVKAWLKTYFDTLYTAAAHAVSTSHSGIQAPTAENDFAVGNATPFGSWVRKTLAEVKTILGLGSAAYAATGDFTPAAHAGAAVSSSHSGIEAPTAEHDFLLGNATPFGLWIRHTLAEVKTALGLGSAAYTASGDYATAAQGTLAANAIPKGTFTAAQQELLSTGSATYTVLLHKRDATAAPAVTDDSGDGYAVGSRWIDITADNEYVCVDATVGAAVWHQTDVAAGAPAAHAASHTNGGDNIAVATTSAVGFAPQATAPGAGLLNLLGIANGETARTDKVLFDATNPANNGTAAPGTAMTAARRDHVHATDTALVPKSTGTTAGDRLRWTASATVERTACLVALPSAGAGAWAPALVAGAHHTVTRTGIWTGITPSGLEIGEGCSGIIAGAYATTTTGVTADATDDLADIAAASVGFVLWREASGYRMVCWEKA